MTKIKLKEKITNEYIQDLLVRMAHHSTALERNTLTQAETTSILLYNYIPKDTTEREYFEVKNYRKALYLLLNNKEELSPNLIKNYHKLIMENLIDNNGKYKKIQNIIVGSTFETAKPYQVPVIVQKWCDNYNFRMKNAKSDKKNRDYIGATY